VYISALITRDRRLLAVLRRLRQELPRLLNREGEPINVQIGASARRRWTHRAYEDANANRHCYTQWKDQDGKYWVWTYQSFGKGARDRNNRKRSFRAKDLVRCSTRKLAEKKARARWNRNPNAVKGVEV